MVMGFLRKSLATIEAVSWLGVVVLVGKKKKKKSKCNPQRNLKEDQKSHQVNEDTWVACSLMA